MKMELDIQNRSSTHSTNKFSDFKFLKLSSALALLKSIVILPTTVARFSMSRHSRSDRADIGERLLADGVVFSLAVFGATAIWFVRNVVRAQILPETSFQKRRQKSLQDLQQQSTLSSSSSSSKSAPLVGEVGTRGKAALIPMIPYLHQFSTCFQVRNYNRC
jgi:hypothetical protein